ncbi:MAG TPA: hypothetical protein DCY93_01725 [Firmicutes bacterium]|nr:hypothetical protein [Bacillota bacterium]
MKNTKYTISLNPKSKISEDIVEKSIDKFYNHLFKLTEEKLNDVHFVIGGDGTLLKALNHFGFKGKYVVIKDAGSLGFYSDFDNLDDLNNVKINSIKEEFFYPLSVLVNNKEYFAANEVSLVNVSKVINFSMDIKQHMKQNCRSSGILFSTKLGSTGLSLSCNGPIIFDEKVYYFNLLAPLLFAHDENVVKSGVISNNDIVKIDILNEDATLVIDGNVVFNIKSGDKIVVTSSNVSFSLLHFNEKTSKKRYHKIGGGR